MNSTDNRTNVELSAVRTGHNIQGDYAEGTVRKDNDHGILVEWFGEGNDFYTWEQVREYGFTFFN